MLQTEMKQNVTCLLQSDLTPSNTKDLQVLELPALDPEIPKALGAGAWGGRSLERGGTSAEYDAIDSCPPN